MDIPKELGLPADYKLPDGWRVTDVLPDDRMSALVEQLHRETPLSQLSLDDARKVFDHLVKLGYEVFGEI